MAIMRSMLADNTKLQKRLKVPQQTARQDSNIVREKEVEWATRYAVSFLDAGTMKRCVSYGS